MIVRSIHYEKRLERLFGIHTGHNTAGKVRSLVANRVTEFKNFYFWTYGKSSDIKRQPIRIQISGKEIRVMERK
jgi:hypothetical protein